MRVAAPVSPFLEMTEIQTRLLAEGGPAVLFENVVREAARRYACRCWSICSAPSSGSPGAWTASRRQLREIGETLAFLKQPEPPGGWREALDMLPLLRTVMAMRPRTVVGGAVPGDRAARRRHRSRPAADPDLLAGRAGAADHLAAGRHQGPRRGARGRLQPRHLPHAGDRPRHDPDALAAASRRRAASPALARRAKREPLPAAAVIGADPGTILAAVTPVPDTLSEYQFAGLLRGKRVELVDCKTVPLKVPAEAEIVLEGHVSLDEYGDEGPMATTPATTTRSSSFPVFRLSAITMRRDPIYLSTFTGRPPDEPSVLGEALNEVFIPLLQQQFPEIVDFWLPPEGCSYRIAVVSIRKSLSRPRQAGDDGDLVVSAAVHVHEIRHRRGRRHRCARLEGRDVGDLDPHGPGARHHR